MALAGNVERFAALAVEDPLALVDRARQQHDLVHLAQALGGQPKTLVLELFDDAVGG